MENFYLAVTGGGRTVVDFSLPEEHRDILAALPKFIEQEIVPLEKEHKELLENPRRLFQEDGRFVPKVLELRKQVRIKSAEAGFYTLFLSKTLGGAGYGPTLAFHVAEAIWHLGPGVLRSEMVGGFPRGPNPMLEGLPKSTRELVMPGLLSGEKTVCFAFSETEAGSDAWNMKTAAEKRDGKWVINGEKMWITNAPYADWAFVFAVTNREMQKAHKGGVTGFFVDAKARGFKVESVIPFMGYLGGDVALISLENVEVSPEFVIGKVDQGFQVGMLGIGTGRLSLAGLCTGLAEWALEKSVDYAKQRVTFGKPIAERQAIQWMLADSAVDIATCKYLALNAGWRIEKGEMAVKEISMAKLYATEMLFRVMDRAVQVHGGMGLVNEMKLEDVFRISRALRIPDGSSEIQRRIIAKRLLAGDTRL